jgi:hypothetical protein
MHILELILDRSGFKTSDQVQENTRKASRELKAELINRGWKPLPHFSL